MTALERLGRWCATHGWPVVLVWVQVLLLVLGLAVAVGSNTSDDFTVPGSGSKQALDLLNERFPARAGVEGLLVLNVDDGDLRAPRPRAAIADVADRLATEPGVSSVALPEDQRAGGRISADGRTAVLVFALDKAPGEVDRGDVERVLQAAAPARAAGLQTEVGGAVAVAASRPETGAAELVGLAALSALGDALGIPAVAPSLATMIGLGVGIDYALFVVSRYRTQLAAGMPVADAVARATATSGAAVVFAGVTVMIALRSGHRRCPPHRRARVRHQPRRRPGRPRRDHPAARPARPARATHRPAEAPLGGPERPQGVAAVVAAGRPPPVGGRRAEPGCPPGAGRAGTEPAPRAARQRQRLDQHHRATGVRPARRGFRGPAPTARCCSPSNSLSRRGPLRSLTRTRCPLPTRGAATRAWRSSSPGSPRCPGWRTSRRPSSDRMDGLR